MNEAYAVVTSMNMSKVSDDKSIEIGYLTQTDDEYSELLLVFNKHIKGVSNQSSQNVSLSTNKEAKGTKTKPIARISRDQQYINSIHEAIYNNYGIHDYSYNRSLLLEYYSFPKKGFKIQFLLYNTSIRIHICLPNNLSLWEIDNGFSLDNRIMRLSYSDELELIEDRSAGNMIKYYYDGFLNLDDWGENEIMGFLKDMILFIDIVQSHI